MSYPTGTRTPGIPRYRRQDSSHRASQNRDTLRICARTLRAGAGVNANAMCGHCNGCDRPFMSTGASGGVGRAKGEGMAGRLRLWADVGVVRS